MKSQELEPVALNLVKKEFLHLLAKNRQDTWLVEKVHQLLQQKAYHNNHNMGKKMKNETKQNKYINI